MTLDEAKRFRVELMAERVTQVKLQNQEYVEEDGERDEINNEDCLFSGNFNMCEH